MGVGSVKTVRLTRGDVSGAIVDAARQKADLHGYALAHCRRYADGSAVVEFLDLPQNVKPFKKPETRS